MACPHRQIRQVAGVGLVVLSDNVAGGKGSALGSAAATCTFAVGGSVAVFGGCAGCSLGGAAAATFGGSAGACCGFEAMSLVAQRMLNWLPRVPARRPSSRAASWSLIENFVGFSPIGGGSAFVEATSTDGEAGSGGIGRPGCSFAVSIGLGSMDEGCMQIGRGLFGDVRRGHGFRLVSQPVRAMAQVHSSQANGAAGALRPQMPTAQGQAFGCGSRPIPQAPPVARRSGADAWRGNGPSFLREVRP